MKNIPKAISYFIKLPLDEKMKILYIVIFIVRATLIIKLFPLKNYFFKYFGGNDNQTFDLQAYNIDINLIKHMMKFLPGKQTCLKESIVVHLHLKRYGEETPIFLGIKTKGRFRAHAWYDMQKSNGFNQIMIRHGKERHEKRKLEEANITEA